jgi:hypothetical protein
MSLVVIVHDGQTLLLVKRLSSLHTKNHLWSDSNYKNKNLAEVVILSLQASPNNAIFFFYLLEE